jgi:signal transduction histidine kinase/CheY-like chemotaxis protein
VIEPSSHAASRPRILVVDDEPALGRALLDMLADEPVQCVWVDSAPEALERLAFGNYDLVLTDILMPKVGGLELLRAIEELDPELPVVLVTNEGEPEAAVEAVRARAFDFLWKPVDPVALLEAVRRGIATRRKAVCARELAAAERRRLERRSLLLSILFEQGSDCVLTWDQQGRLVDLSPGIAALTGVELEHLLAAGSAELFEREPFGGAIEDRIRELARKPGRLQSQEVVVRTREGPTPTRLTLMVCELPPAEDGELPVCWIVGLLQPPEREDLRDRLRRADRLTGAAMVSSVAAHEIKNDLGPLLTCMTLLEDANVDDELGEVLTAASDCVRRIGAGVERILAPLRPQLGHPRRLAIGELVRDSVSFVCRSSHEPRPRIVLEVAPTLPEILARPDDIHQIVVNLVANAFEAIEAARRADDWTRPAGQCPTICVRVFDDPEAERVVLEVQDDGPGIDPSAQTRVFEPFFTTKGSRGTGLGLPVVRDLVRGLGGDLTIVSVPVIAGTCVRVGLPREAPLAM